MANGGFIGGKSRKGAVRSKSGRMFAKGTTQWRAIMAGRKRKK